MRRLLAAVLLSSAASFASASALEELRAAIPAGFAPAVVVPRAGPAVPARLRRVALSGRRDVQMDGNFTATGSMPYTAGSVTFDVRKNVDLSGDGEHASFRYAGTFPITVPAQGRFSGMLRDNITETLHVRGGGYERARCRVRVDFEGNVVNGTVSVDVRGRVECALELDE